MKIGDYVRTKDGIILKIEDIEDIYTTDNIYVCMAIYDNEGRFVNEVEIIKSSPNIIDLIEVGDYVNGCPVLHKENNELVCGLLLRYKEENIQNVVTKEQFENISYKVGEQ